MIEVEDEKARGRKSEDRRQRTEIRKEKRENRQGLGPLESGFQLV